MCNFQTEEIPQRIKLLNDKVDEVIEEFTAYPALHNAFHSLPEEEIIEIELQIRAKFYKVMFMDREFIKQGLGGAGLPLEDDKGQGG